MGRVCYEKRIENMNAKRYIVYIFLYAVVVAGTLLFWHMLNTHIGKNDDQPPPDYHFVIFGKSEEDAFWANVHKGAAQAAKEYNVALQYLYIQDDDNQNIDDLFYTAIKSDIDGIITYVYDENKYGQLIDLASANGIPVVTIDTDAPYSSRVCHVGLNNYEFGQTLGALVENLIGGRGNISLIVGAVDGYMLDDSQNLRLKGFNEYLSKNDDILLIRDQYSTGGIVSATQISRDILETYYSIDAIVCTTPTEALGAAQVVMEMDRDIKIICQEENDQILKYINSGVINSAVVSNPYEIGYKCIDSMIAYITTGTAKAVYVHHYIVVKENVDQYINSSFQSYAETSDEY